MENIYTEYELEEIYENKKKWDKYCSNCICNTCNKCVKECTCFESEKDWPCEK